MSKYYILISLDGKTSTWQERKGTRILDTPFVLFGEKRDDKYIITEAYSGRTIASGTTKKAALESYRILMEYITFDVMKKRISESIEKHGESPLFEKTYEERRC